VYDCKQEIENKRPMQKKVKAAPNQSLLDMVATEYGTLEAAIAVCAANNMGVSYQPATGEDVIMPDVDSIQKQEDNVLYLRRNNLVIGTVAKQVPDYRIVLKPAMQVVTNVTGNPHVLGYYSFDFVGLPSFLNVYPLADDSLSDNRLHYATEDRHLSGLNPESAPAAVSRPMSELSIPYVLPWSVGFGYMLVWSSLVATPVSCTFKDIDGNMAYAAPLTLLDNTSHTVIEDFIGDIEVEKVSASVAGVTLRLTRMHAAIATVNMRDYSMVWLGAAAFGIPDPEDPLNDDIILVTLEIGVHTIGIETIYYFPFTTPPYPYPSSARTMVIKVF